MQERKMEKIKSTLNANVFSAVTMVNPAESIPSVCGKSARSRRSG